MGTRNHGSNRVFVRRWAALAALAALSLSAQATTATSDAAFERFMHQSTGTGKQTVNFGSNGTPVTAPGVPSAVPDGGAGVKVTQTGSVPNPSGNNVNVTASGRVGNAQLASKIGKALGKLLPVAGGVAAAVELFDLLGELKYRQDPANPANLQKADPNVCSVAPCYEYRVTNNNNPVVWQPTPVQACQVFAQNMNTLVPGAAPWNYNGISGTGPYTCSTKSGSNQAVNNWTIVQQSKAAVPPVYNPATLADLEAEIASKAGWPSTSNIARAGVKAAEVTGERYGWENPTVTGPASSAGPAPKVTTAPNPDGSTKTTTQTTTHNHTYNTNVINTTTTTVTNITNNGTSGATSTSTETTEPEPDKTECERSPDTVGCAKLDTVTGEVPKAERTVAYVQENMGWGSGACPANPSWSDALGSHSINLAPYCTAISSWVRPLVLAMAALMALAIVVPGFKAGD